MFTFSASFAADSICIEGINERQARLIDSLHKLESESLIINGGYFDLNHQPVGYFKRDGRIINSQIKTSLSGFVAIDKRGKIDICDKSIVVDDWQTVIQAGPFVIDKGGKMGIRKSLNRRADRMVLIKLNSGAIFVEYHPRIDLYDVAALILKNHPTVDMALNLDGGPSCCVLDATHEINPEKPLPYYIEFGKALEVVFDLSQAKHESVNKADTMKELRQVVNEQGGKERQVVKEASRGEGKSE